MIMISMNIELLKTYLTIGTVEMRANVHLKKNLVNNFTNMGTAFLSVQSR